MASQPHPGEPSRLPDLVADLHDRVANIRTVGGLTHHVLIVTSVSEEIVLRLDRHTTEDLAHLTTACRRCRGARDGGGASNRSQSV